MRNFLKGYGSALTLTPSKKFPRIDLTKLNFPKNNLEALRKDWEAIGKDIAKSMAKIDKEINDSGRRK